MEELKTILNERLCHRLAGMKKIPLTEQGRQTLENAVSDEIDSMISDGIIILPKPEIKIGPAPNFEINITFRNGGDV